MAAIFQIRRGSGSAALSDGELYVNKGPDSLQYAVGEREITLAKLDELNTGSLYLKGGISASGDITASNLYVSGNVVLGGTITIGDSTSDNVIVNSPFSGSIIPSGSNVFDLGSDAYKYRNIHATSISGAIAATNGVISGSSQITYISISSIPAGIVSGSTQVDADSITNFDSNVKAKLDTDGVISGSAGIIPLLPTGTVSGSTQIANLGYATTGSNSFIGNQTITGSLIVSGSTTQVGNIVLTGSLTISGSSTFRNIGPTILSGSVLVSGSINSDGYQLDASLTQNIPALNTAFNSDFSSSASTFINKSLVLGGGKVLVAGRFESVDGHTTNDIARFNSNGTIDTSFSSPVFSTTIGGDSGGYINTFVTQSDGKIVVGGSFSRVNGVSRVGLARLDVNGTLDATFVTQSWGSFGEVRDIVIQNDDKIVCVGSFPSGSRRVNTDGTIDTSLVISTSPGFGDDNFYSVALLPSGSEEAILIGGNFQQWNSFSDYHHLVKLHPSGALDFGFAGANLDITTGNSLDRINKIKVGDAYTAGDNGYIYIAGRFKDTRVGAQGRNAGFARLTTDDVAFGRGAYDNGFRLYISGSDQNNPGGAQYVNDFDFYDGDKFLLGGSFTSLGNPLASYQTTNRFIIVDDSGDLISGFSSSTYNLNTGSVNSVTLIPTTTNVLVGGTFTQANSTAREGLASLKLAGLGNVTTTSEYTISANINELLISSSNTYFTGNITASVISASFVGNGSGLTGVTAGDVEFQNILNKPTLISGSSQLSGTTITNLTITNLTTVNETASVIFSSGSNRFGDFGDDIHSFTGSVQISGSQTITGSSTATSYNGTINATNGVVSGSSQVDITSTTNYTTFSSSVATSISTSVAAGAPTFENITGKPAGLVSGSAQITPLLPSGVVSGSLQTILNLPTNTISSSAQITTFGFVSSSVTASSLVTASFNGNILTFTIGNGSTFDVTVVAPAIVDLDGYANFNEIKEAEIAEKLFTSSFNEYTASQSTGSLATTGSNSFNGNQIITGSLTISGSVIISGSVKGNIVPITIASSTASLDMNDGNYFTLTLANTTTTHIRATNITPGITATLLITTGTDSSASLSPLLLQPSGSSYTASLGSGKKDVLSLVAFDSTNMYVVSTKAME